MRVYEDYIAYRLRTELFRSLKFTKKLTSSSRAEIGLRRSPLYSVLCY